MRKAPPFVLVAIEIPDVPATEIVGVVVGTTPLGTLNPIVTVSVSPILARVVEPFEDVIVVVAVFTEANA